MRKIIVFLIVFLISSCTNENIYSGKILNQDKLNNLNFENKTNLLKNLGNPSFIDPIEKKYFYFSELKNKKSAYNKKINYSYLFVFEFDQNDAIISSKVYDLKSSKNIKLVEKETDNQIVKRGLLESIFGGVGPQQELPTTP